MYKYMYSHMHTCIHKQIDVCLPIYTPKFIHLYSIHTYIHAPSILTSKGELKWRLRQSRPPTTTTLKAHLYEERDGKTPNYHHS